MQSILDFYEKSLHNRNNTDVEPHILLFSAGQIPMVHRIWADDRPVSGLTSIKLSIKFYQNKAFLKGVKNMSSEIKFERNLSPKAKPDQNNLGFGQYFTDHMFVMDYTKGKGWHDARIVPYGPLQLDPSTMVFHYGQAIFEGLKAYRAADGRILLFRPTKNMERVNISNDRLCIPPIDIDFAVEAIKTLVKIDNDWIPQAKGTSLYIRPFIIATDPFVGVRPSNTYKFIVILSPVGAYYKEGINPVKIYVESSYVRAVKGGIGFAKTPGNYAASLKAQEEAHEKGYTQVLWLDGVEKKYIEEVGTMNVFFKINGEIITPALLCSFPLLTLYRNITIVFCN
jgi:branched-chain amino acid aminotransferase